MDTHTKMTELYQLEYRIILTAETKDELNKLIDGKLKASYLLENDMYEGEKNKWSQVMTLSQNIEGEVTLSSAAKLVLLIAAMLGILYYTH